MEKYQEEYQEFLEAYRSGATDSSYVGELIVRMAHYFSEANLLYASKDVAYNKLLAENENQRDPNSGKPLTSTKAKALTDASPEAEERSYAHAHLVNIETNINALKALQKGLMNEYSHMGAA